MWESIVQFVQRTGLYNLSLGNIILMIIGGILIYLAIAKEMEPYELLPIGFGLIIGNLPLTRLMADPLSAPGIQGAGILGIFYHYGLYFWNVLPPLIFLGVGAMTDFGPMIANPKVLLFGSAAQVGIFVAFWGALLVGFTVPEACTIGIIGGADGPTTIYTGANLAPHLMAVTATIAYSYMALVALIQPPIMRLLTTERERAITMKQLRPVSKIEKLFFPLIAMVLILLFVPLSAPLIGMLMLGNFLKESGVVKKLSDAAQNEILNVVTILLMLCIGASMSADLVLHPRTLFALFLGLIAFGFGSASGILLAKFLNLFVKEKVNPLIGSAGVSAVPMAARVSQIMGQRANARNFLLMHALGANVSGVIGSAIAAGVFLSLVK
jgi:oxaloacetate decarboxylase beta subunit